MAYDKKMVSNFALCLISRKPLTFGQYFRFTFNLPAYTNNIIRQAVVVVLHQFQLVCLALSLFSKVSLLFFMEIFVVFYPYSCSLSNREKEDIIVVC